MFDNLLSRLRAKTATPLPDPDAKRALGALLVRIAKSDKHYAFEEISQIDTILAKRYDLSSVAAAKLRHECEMLETQAPDTETFAALVKNSVPYADRSAIIESLWSVVMADGIERPEEDEILDRVAAILGVATQDLKHPPT
ncbi:MAG: TerB family tellurite resistance protein [Pseudoruegeria sp.]